MYLLGWPYPALLICLAKSECPDVAKAERIFLQFSDGQFTGIPMIMKPFLC